MFGQFKFSFNIVSLLSNAAVVAVYVLKFLAHGLQVAMVKEEYRKNERAQTRNGVDMTYVKNVILKLLETGIVFRL